MDTFGSLFVDPLPSWLPELPVAFPSFEIFLATEALDIFGESPSLSLLGPKESLFTLGSVGFVSDFFTGIDVTLEFEFSEVPLLSSFEIFC